jgi:L-fuconolactonase
MPMLVVDSHCHCSPFWFEPVESLLFAMDRNEVDAAVLIQFNGQTNNDYLFDCVRRYPDRFAAVVLVDYSRAGALDDLEQLAERGATGVRLPPFARSGGDDPLAIWRAADRLGLAVSCGGEGADFATPAFAELVSAFPRLPMVLEHLGSVNHPDGEGAPYATRRQVFALARFPNVHIKVHGVGEIAERPYPFVEPLPFVGAVPPIMEMAFEAFGPERMMWGSDYPPVSSREGYRNALRFTRERFADKSEAANALIFGDTAQRVFRVRR